MQVVGEERWRTVVGQGAPFVLLSWHEALLPVLWHHRRLGIAALVSEARDGEYLARLAQTLGYRLIRGSSTRGGTRALRDAIQALRRGIPVGLTPDGPRGPRRVVKAGAVAAAERGRAVVVPVHAEARPAWRAGSWDRFLVPPPFAQVRLAYGEPFMVEPGAAARPAQLARVTRELDQAARLATWPDGAATPIG